MPKAGKQRIQSYGLEFKLRAVQLSNQPGVLVKDVADSLDIHPFMLSKWRKQVRDGEDLGMMRSDRMIDTDAQGRPLPSVASFPGRRSSSRQTPLQQTAFTKNCHGYAVVSTPGGTRPSDDASVVATTPCR